MNKNQVTPLLRFLFCVALWEMFYVPLTAFAQPQNQSKLRLAVTPHPQEVFTLNDKKGVFKVDADTTIRVSHDDDLPGAQLFSEDVRRRTGLVLKAQKGSQKTSSPSTNVISVSRAGEKVTLGLDGSVLSRREVKRSEGYSLTISDNRVLIRASDARGAVYGIQTLRQLLRHDQTLPNLVIRDWPEMPSRMVYGNYNGPFQSKEEIDGYVNRALLLKYNAIVFESLWHAGGNWWFNHHGEKRELAKYFQQTCQKYHIDFIPLIQGPGWGYGITDQAPMLSAGEWIKAEKQKLAYNTPTTLAQSNVVTNDAAPIVVTDLETKVHYQKDKDFTIIPGNTIRPYEQNNDPWKLQAIKGGTIEDGQEVLISYNAVTKRTPHQAWSISDPRSFEILDATLDMVQGSLNPPIIHIGHDEIWQLGSDSRDIQSGLTNQQLVYRDLMHWYTRIKKNNPEAQILMWDDLLRPEKLGVTNGILSEVAKDIPKDIVVVPWFYYANNESAPEMEKRAKHLASLGFPFIGAPAGYFRENSYLWYKTLQPYLKDGRAKGMMFTSWDLLHRGDITAAADLMWSGQKIDRNLYKAMDTITERVKTVGLVLNLDPKLQTEAFVAIITKGLKENKTLEQISEEFNSQVIGTTSLFEQAIGQEAWRTLAKDAAFPEQEMANLQRVPQFVQAMTDYLKADAAKDKTLLRKVIHSLHALNYFDFEKRNELLTKSDAEWISFKELFGVDQPTAG